MAYVNTNGYKLFYQVEGQGDRSLIFIHGLCGDHRVWSKNIPDFINDYKVVSIDMFGHGNSEKDIDPKLAFELMSKAIQNIIEQEKLEACVLIGHSIAGNILLNCFEAKLKDIAGFIFVDCAFNANEKVINSRNKRANSILGHAAEEIPLATGEWYKTMMDRQADPNDNELILSALKSPKPGWPLNFLKTSNFIRQIPNIKVPVLIFESNWMTKDEPERSFKAVLKNAEFSHWPVNHHFFFVYEAPKFNQILKKFLSEKIFA